MARIQVPNLGEYYSDNLRIEAWMKDRSIPNEANSLLCSILHRRTEVRQAMLEQLAAKRGITVDALRQDILVGKATHLSQEEYEEIIGDDAVEN